MDSILPSSETLAVTASVAIAIAGFSGVVVALRGNTADSFDELDRTNLQVLLQCSAVALLFSLVPLVASRAFEPSMAWQFSMLLYGAVHFFHAGSFAFRSNAPTRAETAEQGMKGWLTPFIGMVIGAGQVGVAWFASAVWIEVGYLLVLIWHLCVAGLAFANLAFATKGQKAD